jgi:hypothetical protein
MLKSPQKLTTFAYKYGYARTSSYEYVMDDEEAIPENQDGETGSPEGNEGNGGEIEEIKFLEKLGKKKEVNLMIHLTNEAIQVKSKHPVPS